MTDQVQTGVFLKKTKLVTQSFFFKLSSFKDSFQVFFFPSDYHQFKTSVSSSVDHPQNCTSKKADQLRNKKK